VWRSAGNQVTTAVEQAPAEGDVRASPRRATLRSSCAAVLGSRGRRLGFVSTATALSLGYTILLPFKFTQRVSLDNWQYLSGYLLAWSVLLGSALAFVLVVQVYAIRQVTVGRSTAFGGAVSLASLLPSLLCCTPIVPTVLAAAGLSGMTLLTTSASLQYIFAAQQTAFLAGSLALLALVAWWNLRRVARAACLGEDGCAVADPAATDDQNQATTGGQGR
jgi:uncharacterized membrane protein